MEGNSLRTRIIRFFIIIIFCCLSNPSQVNGHGRLMEPPNRSSLWRLPEFQDQDPPIPINYDDDQLYCGAIGKMVQNGGKCGVCGDDWEDPIPRDNENGGKYGLGIVVRNYQVGQIIDIAVDITTSHWGYFEFRICPLKDKTLPEDYHCFDDYLLELVDGSGTRYNLTSDQPGWYNTSVRLPTGLQCERCVLQWHYRAGNTWNFCGEDEQLGNVDCGYQETFRGCSDISIGHESELIVLPPVTSSVLPVQESTSSSSTSTTVETETTPEEPSEEIETTTTGNRRQFPTMRPPSRPKPIAIEMIEAN